ncbi:MAG: amidohydrolase family protein, partial [Caldilineaceae bacterium]|nr:amidohydrolase family protein [Caldilineaceae bacterium]
HVVPPEFAGRAQDYVDLIAADMLPRLAAWYDTSWLAGQGMLLGNDVFCEQHAFDVAQSRQVLEAGAALGLPGKIHVDQFTALGGLEMAAKLGVLSADHLDVTTATGAAALAASSAVGVLMPAVNFNLGHTHFADGRGLIDAGVAVALATDINPGSAPCPSMPMVMALACRYNKLLPSEALNAATINAAHALGLGDSVGSLEPGKQADLLIIQAADYRYLAYEFGDNLVETVIKRGVVLP